MDFEVVKFSYYSYQPRIEVSFGRVLRTVPIVGDYIHVKGSDFIALSPKIEDFNLIKEFGSLFIVTSRVKFFQDNQTEDWRIELKPSDIKL